mmetsp:Transcript_36585/g.92489  ORF Transcript_36585/g.92489 Transcript_36585/m.92489 type:complete len:216 (+) Transcript_36585:1210-1857(+)
MVTPMRPPPDAILVSIPAADSSSHFAFRAVTNSWEEPSGTSRPSVRTCRRTRLAPEAAQPSNILWSWSSRECTPPLESKPMKWTVLASKAELMYFQPSSLKIEPSSSAMSTSRAPCAISWPEPSALWPTSLLPMSSSVGRPTAVPCACTVLQRSGAVSLSASVTGVSADAMALYSSCTLFSPQPSRMHTITGASGFDRVGWGASSIAAARRVGSG